MTSTVYTGNGWEIHEGRWQDSAPESVDVVISDPPYDERTHKGGRKGIRRASPDGGSKEICARAPIGFDPVCPVDVGPLLLTLARRWVVLFCSAEQLGGYRDACGDNYIRGGIYVKTNPTPQFTGDRPGQWGDGIAILHRKGRKRWNRGGHAAIWSAARGQVSERVHETQKPIGLMLQLVSDFSDSGELVWDPYCGSGTTGIACMRLGRRFLGHEMQPHYAEIAAERLTAEERGLTLQDVWRGQMGILDTIENDPIAPSDWLATLTETP